MKVLMIAPEPFFEPRGTPISAYQRLRALASLGHEVHLLTYPIGEDVSIPGVLIHRTVRLPFVKRVKVGPSWVKLPLDILLLLKAIWMLWRERFDVIHSHEEAAFFSVVLASAFRTFHVYDMHSSLPRQLENFKFGNVWPVIRLFETLERWVLNTSDVIITIGSDLEVYVRRLKPDANSLTIENLPVQTDENPAYRTVINHYRALLNGRVPVVYAGTFERYQGLDLLLGSAEIVRRRGCKVIFILVGGRPDQIRYWEEQVRENQLEDYVIFVGTVPLDEAFAYLELADILVSPRIEGTSVPLKIYSYLHAGKPMVVTDIQAHSQVLGPEVAVLVAPTVEEFADALVRLIQDPSLREDLGRRAGDYAKERYNPSVYLAKVARAYGMLPKLDTSAGQSVHPMKS